MQIRILWVVSILLLVSQLGYWLIDRGNTDKKVADSLEELVRNKDKQNQIDVVTRTQNNQITYMKYKIDSLKVELSNYQIAFDEYRRENQQELALIISDIKAEGSKRKSEDLRIKKDIKKKDKNANKKINNNKQSIQGNKNLIERHGSDIESLKEGLDRVKPKSKMNDDEYEKYKESQQESN